MCNSLTTCSTGRTPPSSWISRLVSATSPDLSRATQPGCPSSSRYGPASHNNSRDLLSGNPGSPNEAEQLVDRGPRGCRAEPIGHRSRQFTDGRLGHAQDGVHPVRRPGAQPPDVFRADPERDGQLRSFHRWAQRQHRVLENTSVSIVPDGGQCIIEEGEAFVHIVGGRGRAVGADRDRAAGADDIHGGPNRGPDQ